MKWVLLRKNACFHGKNDLPAYVPVSEKGFLVALKLVYVSGVIKCYGSAQGSNFGCADDHTKFSVIVCDSKRQIIFPSPNQAITYDGSKLYQYPGFTTNENEVIFSEFANPVYIKEGQYLTVWNVEDLVNNAESDNSGSACVDVYGSLVDIAK